MTDGKPERKQAPLDPDEVALEQGEEKVFPLLVLEGLVSYPQMLLPLNVEDERDIKLIDEVMFGDRLVALFTRRPTDDEEAESDESEIGEDDFHPVGNLGVILKMLRMPDGSMRLMIQGLQRIRLEEFHPGDDYDRVRVSQLEETEDDSVRIKALRSSLGEIFEKIVKLSNRNDEVLVAALNIEENARLADFVAANLNLELADRLRVLETADVEKRLELVTKLAVRELEVLKIGQSIQDEISEGMERTQREYYLRQQLEAIKRELGESDQSSVELDELAERVEEKDWPEAVDSKARRELKRLRQMNPGSAEYVVAHTYLTWLLDLPWEHYSADRLDIERARRILDEDHYGLSKIKDRILEFLAVRKLAPESKGPILCFVGPPGTGKTSIGRSIARALGRQFVRASLGGVHDEAEIRGHRRTYVGALPGRILQGLKTAGTSNPVYMLDEIDKLASDFRGDPSSALLEVLDPEQNNTFRDNYIEEPYDLSHVFFITTANTTGTIPRPLLDRMEVIEFDGYTREEKAQIAKRYLFPRRIEANGLTREQLFLPIKTLRVLADSYTREAGVRNLERAIGTICRKVARKVAAGKLDGRLKLQPGELAEYLGPPRVLKERRKPADMIGVATGLVWTPVGGDIVFIEAAAMPGKGGLTLTGQLGDVMQESARIALSHVRARAVELGLDEAVGGDRDIHIHVPAGAVPKDGPSAGVTMVAALVSLFSGRPVRNEVGMTGEITLRGDVLPVGGLKSKLLAARRAGLQEIILPAKNEPEIEDAFKGDEKRAIADLELHYVKRVDEVIDLALERKH